MYLNLHLCKFKRQRVIFRAGTRLFKNRRLIEYLKEATRSARLGTRSVLGAAGKVEIWIIFDIKQSKKCHHKTSTFAFLFLFNPPNITKPSNCREISRKHDGKLCRCLDSTWEFKKFNLEVFQGPCSWRWHRSELCPLCSLLGEWPEKKRDNKVLWWYHKSHKPPEILAQDGVQVGDWESSGVEACPVWDHLGPLQVQVHHVTKVKWKVEEVDHVSGQVVL